MLQTDHVLIMTSSDQSEHCLYTIGNTDHGYPELLMFCKEFTQERNGALLRNISRFMQKTKAIPQPHRRLTYQKSHFYPLEVDPIFINYYADLLLLHYGGNARPSMIQLLRPDHNGHFPHEPQYQPGFFEQPILKSH